MSDRIVAATAEHDALLHTIADTQHAKAAYAAAQLCSKVSEAMRRNKQTAEKLRNRSSLHKLIYPDKAAAESAQAEFLYTESIYRVNEAKLSQVNREIEDLKKKREELRAMETEHNHAIASLDALYNSVIDSPTPGVPGEGTLEATVTVAQDRYDVQARLSHTMVVANNLDKAHQCDKAETADGLKSRVV